MSDNKALTLEQLREMDGEPVWVERNESPHDGKWFIVDHADIENPDKTLYTKEGVTYSDYGAYFTAYAYPPTHIDREAWVCPYCTPDAEGYVRKFGAYSIHNGMLETGHCKPQKIKYCPHCSRPLTE